MKKTILTALVVLAMATVASAGTNGIMRGNVNPNLRDSSVMSAVAQQQPIHEQNISLALLERRCVELADFQPWLSVEHRFLGIKYTTDITNPETDIKRCETAISELSSIIGEVTGAISDADKKEAMKYDASHRSSNEKFVEDFESLVFENFHACTSVAVANSDFGFIGSHNRFERCRSAINDIHKIFSGSEFVNKIGYRSAFTGK